MKKEKEEEIPKWWVVWLLVSPAILVGLWFWKTFGAGLFGGLAFLSFGAIVMCGRSDRRANVMATAFYFFCFIVFLAIFILLF